MLGRFLPLLAFLPALGAQTQPIEVTASIAPIDPTKWVGFKEGRGLFMFVRNTSGRDIQGFALEARFTDPQTGKPLGGHRGHSEFNPRSNGLLAPGATKPLVRPYPVPVTASGAPGAYAFSVDLVIFEDGTTWGPGRTPMARKLLQQIAHPSR
ncbi:MAG TPA: hypothetical protein VMG40_11925 [Bryobacteraceae bacterium]|nr:hypothetical protein [Bryobacteraceae bacterium]